jgi:O-antigen ligase
VTVGAGSGAASNVRPLLRPGPPGADRARLAGTIEAGLGGAALLFFPLLVIAPRGIAALASVAVLFGLVLLATKSRQSFWRHFLTVPAALLAVLVLWGAASAAWSPDPLRSLDQAARIAGLVIAAAAMASAERILAPRRLAGFLLAGFVVAILMATVDLATGGALSKPFSDRVYQPAWLNQASDAFAILLLPTGAAMAAGRSRLAGLIFVAIGAAMIVSLAGTAAKVALAVGALCALLCYYRRGAVARIASLFLVLAVVTAPLTFACGDRISGLVHAADWVKTSAGHRLLIWSFVGDRIAEHPLRGWGLEASRAIPGGSDPIRPDQTWLPLHPHNAPLQIWLELGVPGIVPFALLCGWIWLAAGTARWPRLYAAAACGGLATAVLASFATYGVWQEWWQGTLIFSLFMTLVMARVAAAGLAGTPADR